MEIQNSSSLLPYFFAILSNLCFGTASIRFSQLAKRFSSAWMNQVKVTIAFFGFVAAFFAFETYVPLNGSAFFALFGSGIIGLFLGDWFLFQAFAHLGATRTLVIYSFQPFLIALYGFFFLNQHLNHYQILAILCMIGCVFTFLLERTKQVGHWDLKYFSFAFLGIFFDALGVVLSRQAYEQFPDLGSFQANGLRATGAVIAFILFQPSSIKKILFDFKKLGNSLRFQAVGASLLGTFLSLSLYLHALKTAHVASLTAISITGPLWVSLIEHGREKKWPSHYLWIAFGFFIIGFLFLSLSLR
jgi:threonine/homoserine efflux transporter RhtA